MSDDSFCFTVTNLSQLDGTKLSEKKRVAGFLWRMMVIRKDMITSSQSGKSRSLGVYLQKIPETSNLQGDTAVVEATITIVSHENPEKSYRKDFKHTFTNGSTDWGYTSFIKWKDLTNPAKGFIKDDAILLKADIKVVKMHNDVPSSCSSLLTCPSCVDDYQPQGNKQPMSLRCGHTFCSECLDTKCKSVSDSKVLIVCTQCKQEHSGGTPNDLWFPNHSVIQMIGNVIPKSKYFCDIHKQNMDYYCVDDHCLVCIGCAYQGQHSGHSCKLVSEAKTEVERSLDLVAKKVRSKKAELSRKLQLLKDEQKALKVQEDSLIQVVEDSYLQMEKMIQRQKELQLQELKMHTEDFLSTVDNQIRSFSETSAQVQSSLKEFAVWQTLSAKDALHNAANLKATLEVNGSLSVDTAPKTNPSTTISFVKPYSELLSAIEKQGRLDFSGTELPFNVSKDSHNDVLDGSQTEMFHDSLKDDGQPPNKKKRCS